MQNGRERDERKILNLKERGGGGGGWNLLKNVNQTLCAKKAKRPPRARSQHLVGAIRKFKIAQVKVVNVNGMGVIDKTAENNALNILGKSSC